MKDRIPGAPGRYSAVVSGQELQKLQAGKSFAITLTRDDQPIEEGTPYSKAAVLPDDVAVLLCPDLEDPVPADAFRTLGGNAVAEQGQSGVWYYRKWADGLAECWATLDFDVETGSYSLVQQELPFAISDCQVHCSSVADQETTPGVLCGCFIPAINMVQVKRYSISEVGDASDSAAVYICGRWR